MSSGTQFEKIGPQKIHASLLLPAEHERLAYCLQRARVTARSNWAFMMVASSDGHATLHVEASSTRRELVLPFVRPQKAARFFRARPGRVQFFFITYSDVT